MAVPIIFTIWLAAYCVVHLRLRLATSDEDAFEKYEAQWGEERAGRVYKAKSTFMVLLLVLHSWCGFSFHAAVAASFGFYALEMNLRLKPTRATLVYLFGACAMAAEWAFMRWRGLA